MDKIEFHESKIVLIETAFGGLSKSELSITHDELSQYEIQLDISGDVVLDKLISVGEGESTRLNLDVLPGSNAEIRKKGGNSMADTNAEALPTSADPGTRPEGMPRVPEVSSFKDDSRRRVYQRLINNPDSQPAVLRRLLWNEEKMTKRELANWMKEHGYEPNAGSFNECLLVLDEVTDDIERHGRGEDQRIIWVNN